MHVRLSIDRLISLTARHVVAFIPENKLNKYCIICSYTAKGDGKQSYTGSYDLDCDVPL